MKTTKSFFGLAGARTRLVILAATFMAAMTGFVTPTSASLQSVTLGAQSGTLTSGTAGSATYTVTVARSSGTPNTTTMSVISGLPAGATASFGPASAWSPTTGNGTRTYTLTINVSAAAASGSSNFNVQASGSGFDPVGTGTLTVNPAAPAQPQTITFGPLAGKVYGDLNFNVSATASSGLAVSFAAADNCSVVGASVHLTGAGSCTITASQAGNASYLAAPNVQQTFAIAKADQTITFNALANKFIGDSDFSVSATASSGLAVSFTASGVCTVTVNQVHLTGTLGSCTIAASQAGDANYNAASGVPQTFTVANFTGIELYALPGAAALPGQPVNTVVWGYNSTNSAVTQPGGPTLIFNQGATVTIRLHNQLAATTALLVQGQDMIPDTTGVAAGATKLYTFTASRPGTFLYEAGLVPNAQHQVAMGLYGALIVRPARTDATAAVTSGSNVVNDAAILAADLGSVVSGNGIPAGTTITAVTDGVSFTMSAAAAATGTGVVVTKTAAAYGESAAVATAFNDEAVLVLGEIDPALNNSANPAAFDMRNYAPTYFLINGKPYPNTDPIASAAGRKVLLRYVNAGAKHHSMAVLGLRQVFVAKDASTLPTHNHNVAAETLAPGQTGDAIVTIPAAAITASKFAVYEGNLALHNNGADNAFGGMLTFVTAGAGTAVTGPTASGVAITPNPTNGSVSVALTASINSTSSTVAAAEYFIDTTGAAGSGTSMSGSFGSATVSVNATRSPAQLAALVAGNHTFYVHGQDATGAWGAFSSAVLNLDKAGPLTSGIALTPNPSNGTVSVALHATGSDSATGGSNITAAEYFRGTTPPATTRGTAMTVNVAAPVASLDATIPCTVALPCATGAINVRSQDALGNWGPFATVTLSRVASGPVTSAVSASRNPNNGALPLNASQPVVRVTATMTSTGSTVSGAEGFIDTVGATGTGFPLVPSDGVWNGAIETGTSDIPLATINALSNGPHTIYVRGRDAAGNWGATSTTILTIDKTAPTFTGISLAPNPTFGAVNVTLTVNGAADTGGASVAGGEYWINPPTTTDSAPGSGAQFSGLTATIPVGALADGTYTVRARIRDTAGNWSTGTNGIRQATLTVAPDAIFSNGFETGTSPWGWSSASTNTTSRLNVTTAAALVGTRGLQAQGNNTNYLQYNFGTAANPATGTFDARFYFNPHGNTGTNQDIFVARTTGGTTVFRVRYRWNGGSPQVQIQVGTGTGNALWTGITNGASNRIEVVWQSSSTLQLYVGGTLSQTLTANANSVGQFRLGSVTNGGSATLEYFDALTAKRSVSPLVGTGP